MGSKKRETILRDCPHGPLALSCEICDLEKQVASLLETNHRWQKEDEKSGIKLNKVRDERDALKAKLELCKHTLMFYSNKMKQDAGALAREALVEIQK